MVPRMPEAKSSTKGTECPSITAMTLDPSATEDSPVLSHRVTRSKARIKQVVQS